MATTNSASQDRHVLVINDGQRRAYALEAAAYSIGRDPSNAIVLKSDSISRQHALLLRVPAPGKLKYQYRIIDGNSLGKASANGLFVNEERCSSHELKNGDMIRFGQHIEASYLTVAMGEAEFAQYLESISYQSIKSTAMNAKDTVVADELDWDALDHEIAHNNGYQKQEWVGPESDVTTLNLQTPKASQRQRADKANRSQNATVSPAENSPAKTTAHPWAKTVIDGHTFHDRKKKVIVFGSVAAVLGCTILGAWFFLTQISASKNNAQSVSESVVHHR